MLPCRQPVRGAAARGCEQVGEKSMTYNFFATLSRMKYIDRWALMRNARMETLSEHTLDVAMIAHALCVIGNVRFGHSLNADRAALIGLYHDASEIITGDMPTPVKYFNRDIRDAYKEVEQMAEYRLLRQLPEDMRGTYAEIFSDAETDEDLRKAGERLAASGRLRVTAGCAGFASVLPELLGLAVGEPPRIPKLDDGLFILCGSVNPITLRQLDYAELNGFTRLHIAPEQKLEAGYFATEDGLRTLGKWRDAIDACPWLILDANDAGRDNADTAAYAAKRGMSTEELRSGISSALGVILLEMLKARTARTMLITGGDTLFQCMDRMRVHHMEPLLEIFQGVVLSRFEAMGHARFVITKSGGFGEETLMADLKRLIEEQYR